MMIQKNNVIKSASSSNHELNSAENQSFLAGIKKTLSPKHYAQSRPRLTVEVLSNKTTSLILNSTYLIFFLFVAFDICREILSFESVEHNVNPSSIVVGADRSTVYNINAINTNIVNVLSIGCNVWQTNISSITATLPSNFTCETKPLLPFTYDFSIYACYRSEGCGDSYAVSNGVSQNEWLKVYSVNQVQYSIDICSVQRDGILNITFLDATYQPQESSVYNGIIKSYQFFLSVYDNPHLTLIPTTPEVATSITYALQQQSLNSYVGGIFSGSFVWLFPIAVIISLMSTIVYFTVMIRHQKNWWKWLPEQRLAGMNLLFVLLYQNPVIYIIAVIQSEKPFASNAGAFSYAATVTEFFGFIGFQLTWLVFADPIRYRTKRFLAFYWRKLLDTFFQLAPFIVAVTLLYPTIFQNPPRSAVLLLKQWPTGDQVAYVVSAIIFFFARWFWVFHWLFCCYSTNKRLAKMTYMRTRYIQLSFNFFILQAFWFTLFYFTTFFVATVIVFKNLNNSDRVSLQIASALFVTGLIQGQLAGFRIFISIYSVSLAFLNSPVEIFENQSNAGSNIASTYVVTEVERKVAVKARVKAIRRLNAMQQSLLHTVSSNSAFVFSVELCILLCNSCLEIYFTMPEHIARTKAFSLHKIEDDTSDHRDDYKRVRKKLSDDESQVEKNDDTIGKGVAMQSYLENTRANIAYSRRNIQISPDNQSDERTEDHSISSEVDNERYWEFERLGLSYVSHFYDTRTDTLALLYREVTTRRLILIFRGTASIANAKTDLKLLQIPVDFMNSPPSVPFPDSFLQNEPDLEHGSEISYPKPNRLASVREVDEGGDGSAEVGGENESVCEVDNDEANTAELKKERSEARNLRHQSILSRVSESFRSLTGSRHYNDEHKVEGNDVVDSDSDSDILSNDDDGVSDQNIDNDTYFGSSASKIRGVGLKRAMSVQNIGDGLAFVKDTVVEVATSGAGVVTYVANDKLWKPAKKGVFNCFTGDKYSIPRVHSGFWEAYLTVREDIHSVVRAELLKEPADLLVTGHSLGGALASVCALDLSIHTLAPINLHLKEKIKKNKYSHVQKNRLLAASPKTQLTFLLKTNQIHITMYNFGSPRVGNKMFHSLYKHHVVDSFRVQVDGDVIPGTPISDAINQYEHHGSEVLIDGLDASGSIIINPTSIELRLRARAKTSVTGHSTVTYLKGLAAIVDSVNQHSEDDVDVDCGDGIKVEDVTVAVLAKYDSVRSTDKSGSNMFKFRGKEETKSTPLPSTDPEPSSPSIEFEIDHHDSTFGVRSFEIDE